MGKGPTSFQNHPIGSIFSDLSTVFTQHGSILFNVMVVITTIGGQSLMKKLSFTCPCEYPLNIYHSSIFIVAPIGVLFMTGVMLNSMTWRILHGACQRTWKTRHTWGTTIVAWVRIVLQASVAPVAWMFVTFLDGGYFSCLLAGNFCAYGQSCANTTATAGYSTSPASFSQYLFQPFGLFLSEVFNDRHPRETICQDCICNLKPATVSVLEAQSNIIAFTVLTFFVTVTLLLTCVFRICDRYTLAQRNYVDIYRDEEAAKFEAAAREYAAQCAQVSTRAFFSKDQKLSKSDWDWISGIPSLTNPFFAKLKLLKAKNVDSKLYTPLQLWAANHGHELPDFEVDKTQEYDEAAEQKPSTTKTALMMEKRQEEAVAEEAQNERKKRTSQSCSCFC